MKTKAYKLAAELGLHEQSVLDWLRANGYPNARRADTIRAEVVQAARKALGRGGMGPHPSSGLRPAKPVSRAPEPIAAEPAAPDLRVSFAELLEAHLSTAAPAPFREVKDAGSRTSGPMSPLPARMTGPVPILPALPTLPAPPDVPDPRIARAEETRDAARRETDEWRVRFNRVRSERDELKSTVSAWGGDMEALPALKADRARLSDELLVVRQRMKAADDERATLESTCADLQEEIAEARASLRSLETAEEERRVVQDELQSATQREMAWRARALELERAALLGGSLQAVLSRVGVADVADQASILTGLLSSREGATALLRFLRPTDAEGLSRLIVDRVRRVCVDAICNQVAKAGEAFPMRVDAERDCTVCGGSEDRRWFARMALECDRAGVRRILVVGGSETLHEQLRGLTQGQRIDFRLVSTADEVFPARIQGRIEGCDLLVLFSPGLVDSAVSEPYADAARRAGRLVAHVVSARFGVVSLTRTICNRLTRSLVLTTL